MGAIMSLYAVSAAYVESQTDRGSLYLLALRMTLWSCRLIVVVFIYRRCVRRLIVAVFVC